MEWWKNCFLCFSLKNIVFGLWKLCHLPEKMKGFQCIQAVSSNQNLECWGPAHRTVLCLRNATSWKNYICEDSKSSECGVEKIWKSRAKETTRLTSIFPWDQICCYNFSKPFQTWTMAVIESDTFRVFMNLMGRWCWHMGVRSW